MVSNLFFMIFGWRDSANYHLEMVVMTMVMAIVSGR